MLKSVDLVVLQDIRSRTRPIVIGLPSQFKAELEQPFPNPSGEDLDLIEE